jgi:hypothetical protein
MTHARPAAGSLVEQLERVAQALGLEVRRERLDIGDARAPGGLCRVEGRDVCILAENLSEEEEARALGRALLHFDLDDVFATPAVRAFLERLKAADPPEPPGRAQQDR